LYRGGRLRRQGAAAHAGAVRLVHLRHAYRDDGSAYPAAAGRQLAGHARPLAPGAGRGVAVAAGLHTGAVPAAQRRAAQPGGSGAGNVDDAGHIGGHVPVARKGGPRPPGGLRGHSGGRGAARLELTGAGNAAAPPRVQNPAAAPSHIRPGIRAAHMATSMVSTTIWRSVTPWPATRAAVPSDWLWAACVAAGSVGAAGATGATAAGCAGRSAAWEGAGMSWRPRDNPDENGHLAGWRSTPPPACASSRGSQAGNRELGRETAESEARVAMVMEDSGERWQTNSSAD